VHQVLNYINVEPDPRVVELSARLIAQAQGVLDAFVSDMTLVETCWERQETLNAEDHTRAQ
jgi:hypothetical protein